MGKRSVGHATAAEVDLGLWERVFAWGVGARPIPGGTGAFHWVQCIYHGSQVLLHDGTRVSPGAYILELHLANTRLPHSNGEPAAGQAYLWQLSGELKRDLTALATAARAGQLPDFVAVYGVTSMAPGARRLGFELLAAPDHLATSMMAWWQRVLKGVFHPTGRYRHSEKRRQPLIAWMSWVTLLGVYGDRASRKRGIL